MRSEVFHELDPRFLLLPQLQVTVDGCGDEEISPATRVSVRDESRVQDALGYDAEIQRVPVHERLVILICIWKMLEV